MTAIHWKFGISGLFTTAADWIPGQVPTASDDVSIIVPGTYTVTSSATGTIKTLTTVKTATLAISRGTFSITDGTGSSANAGTIAVADAAVLAIGGIFKNTGKITLNATTHRTGLAIIGNTTLSGVGSLTLSANGKSLIASNGAAAKLINASTIAGAGTIGDAHLALFNQGIIDGNSGLAALTLDTDSAPKLSLPASHVIANSGVIEGTTAEGLVIVSNVSNDGTIEALGANARLLIDGTVTNFAASPLARPGIVRTSGLGAHVDLSSAKISGGRISIGGGGLVETVASSGLSVISGVTVTSSGILEANRNSELRIQSSPIGTTGTLKSNGSGALLDIDGSVGAVAATISGGTVEFKGAAAAHVVFTAGTIGTLKLDASTAFTGTISGFGGLSSNIFSQFLGFGDSSIDSGSFQYLPTGNDNQDIRVQSAVANGGTGSPVGVGPMNPQILAGDFGLTANSAYAPGGGTNYAISGALDAAVPENGDVSNVNSINSPDPDPRLLSTVDQISAYLSSTKDTNGVAHADPNALYLISSGANDASLASANDAYVEEQAANLTAAIKTLVAAGAQHIIVNSIQGNTNLENHYSAQLFADLQAAGVPYVQSDIHGMLLAIQGNLAAFGLDPNEGDRGVQGLNTESALIEPDLSHTYHGWGLWGADTIVPNDSGLPGIQQYAYLRAPDAEQKSLFSDDQHLSAAGQLIQANYDYGLLVTDKVISQDALDLTDIHYALGTTKATYAGNAAGGTLTVTDGTHVAKIALLGNYMASTFVTASDGGTGTLVVDQTIAAQQPAVVLSHGTP